jgi:hypothetical protein
MYKDYRLRKDPKVQADHFGGKMNTLRDVAEWAGLKNHVEGGELYRDYLTYTVTITDGELKAELLSDDGTVAILEALIGEDNTVLISRTPHGIYFMLEDGRTATAPDLPHAVLAAAIAYRKGVRK